MKKFIVPFAALIAVISPGIKADSILDIKHNLGDDNVVAPESFETQTLAIEDNYFLNHCVASNPGASTPRIGTPQQYEEGLKKLPTVVELPYNPLVGKFIDMYLTKQSGLLSDMLALDNYYGPVISTELLKQGLPAELRYLPVVESALNPNAVSRSGAAGLWQFMPATATGLGMEVNSLVDQRRDPAVSSQFAAKYLKQLYDIYKDWPIAIAAFNCGTGNVNKAMRRAGGGKKDFWEIYSCLPQDARGYVPAFIAACYVMNYYCDHGVAPTVMKKRLTTDTVMVNQYIHFDQVSNTLGIPVEELRLLNPQFVQDAVPGDFHPYALTLPKQQCISYVMSEDKIPAYEAEKYARRSYAEPVASVTPTLAISTPGEESEETPKTAVIPATVAKSQPVAGVKTGKMVRKTHVVSRGESIRDIAHEYGVSATDIKLWNNLRRGKVKEGDKLVIEVEEEMAQAEVPVTSMASQASTPEPKAVKASKKTETEPQQPVAKKQPAPKKKKAEPKKPKEHKVKDGESLDRIARQYGVTVKELQQANGMKSSQTTIHAGDKLSLPSKSKSGKKGKSKSKKKRSRRR